MKSLYELHVITESAWTKIHKKHSWDLIKTNKMLLAVFESPIIYDASLFVHVIQSKSCSSLERVFKIVSCNVSCYYSLYKPIFPMCSTTPTYIITYLLISIHFVLVFVFNYVSFYSSFFNFTIIACLILLLYTVYLLMSCS